VALLSFRHAALIVGLSLLAPASAPASAPNDGKVVSEYELKAAFLFNFARFVEWPADAFPNASAPITIGILGEDPFGSALEGIVANEDVRARRLVVRRFASLEDVKPCHMLFVTSKESKRMKDLVARLGSGSTLTVGESNDFTAQAGMIGFETVRNRLRLRINLGAARAARLTISSQLLRQARIVGSQKAQ
jgi:YfiR/HmsC-like